MQTTKRLTWLILVALLLALPACSKTPKADWTVEIDGAVSNPLTLSYADLVKREQTELKDVLMRKSQGEDEVNTWAGPSLAPILQEAGISANASGIMAMATDGYAIQMTMDDLASAIIALQRDGEWIADDEDHGPIRLVCPEKPANHWLFQLVQITVEE